MKKPIFDFSYNWNNKLDCQFFTTFRLHNPQKHILNMECEVYLKGHHHKNGKIADVRKMTLAQVNPFIAGLDAGYDVASFQKIVRTMYSKKVPDVETALFDLVLIQTVP